MRVTTGKSTLTSSGDILLKSSNAGRAGVSGNIALRSGTSSFGNTGYMSIATGDATAGKAGYVSIYVGRGNVGDGGHIAMSAGKTTDQASGGYISITLATERRQVRFFSVRTANSGAAGVSGKLTLIQVQLVTEQQV